MTTSLEQSVEKKRESKPPPRRALNGISAVERRLRPLIIPLLLAGLWEVAARTHFISSSLFPSITDVVKVGADWVFKIDGTANLYSGTWFSHALASTERVMAGFLIGSLAGLVLGVAVGRWPQCRVLLDGLIQGLRPVPVTAWLPLAVIWFGIGYKPAIFLVFLGAFFPAYVNTVQGVSHVDGQLIRAGEMLGLGKRRMLFRVVFPAALPVIATGFRVGLGFSWMCVIVSEMLAVKSGLGYVLWDSYYFANISMVVAAMISVGLLGFISDRLLVLLLQRKLAWAHQEDRS